MLETNSTHVSTNSYGTVAYMPAEMLKDGKMTKAVDVYSFAIIMLELFSGDMVFRGMSSSQVRRSLFAAVGVAARMRLACPGCQSLQYSYYSPEGGAACPAGL